MERSRPGSCTIPLVIWKGPAAVQVAEPPLAEAESSVAHACLIALEQDDASESIPLLTRELSYKPHEFSATRTLFVNGSPEAFATLADHYASRIPEGVAIRWIESNQGSKDVLFKVREAFATAKSNPLYPWSLRLAVLLDQLSDDQAEFLLEDSRIRDRIRSEAFTAATTAALRCLGRLDRPQAIRAARAALVSPNDREREQYAVVLLSLDANEAAWLIEKLAGDSLSSVRDGVGRALAALDVDSLLGSLLAATAPVQLEAACFAAGWAARSPAVSARLEQLVARGNDDVSRDAETSRGTRCALGNSAASVGSIGCPLNSSRNDRSSANNTLGGPTRL